MGSPGQRGSRVLLSRTSLLPSEGLGSQQTLAEHTPPSGCPSEVTTRVSTFTDENEVFGVGSQVGRVGPELDPSRPRSTACGCAASAPGLRWAWSSFLLGMVTSCFFLCELLTAWGHFKDTFALLQADSVPTQECLGRACYLLCDRRVGVTMAASLTGAPVT